MAAGPLSLEAGKDANGWVHAGQKVVTCAKRSAYVLTTPTLSYVQELGTSVLRPCSHARARSRLDPAPASCPQHDRRCVELTGDHARLGRSVDRPLFGYAPVAGLPERDQPRRGSVRWRGLRGETWCRG